LQKMVIFYHLQSTRKTLEQRYRSVRDVLNFANADFIGCPLCELWYNEVVIGDWGRIGLVAVRREILPLCEILQEKERIWQGQTLLRVGLIGGRPVALAEVLPGPVNGALGAQALIVRYEVGSLIGFGSAGALAAGLSPGDLIVSQRAVAHDAGIFLGRRFEPAGVMGRDRQGRSGHRRAFVADPDLVALALDAARTLDTSPLAPKVQAGTIVTGNQVIFSTARKRWLYQTFDALAVEMETAAVAQVAVAYRLPWVAVRAISDNADDDLRLEYDRLWWYLDEGRPMWRHRLSCWWYLLIHPGARRRLCRLHKGLTLAAEQAARLVAAMLQA
jgi:adenosylhomocysteine nucleosidase